VIFKLINIKLFFMKTKLKIIFVAIIFFCLFGLAKNSEAAKINANSCSLSDINSAIASASKGDTISVPAGTCAWASAIVLSKEIKLIGAGIGNTNITCSSGFCSDPINGDFTNVRISGFTFTSNSTNNMFTPHKSGWRIDHNKFDSGSILAEAVWAVSNARGVPTYGLIDNNVFYNTRVGDVGTNAMLEQYDWQNALWALNPDMGGCYNSAMYVENNTFNANIFGNVIDQNYGGRYVFRFNTLNNSGANPNGGFYVESHGNQQSASSDGNRGPQRWEIYNNILNNTGASIFQPFRLRGGTGVVFNNSILGTWSNYEIALDNPRSDINTKPLPQGPCDGNSAWDQNTPGQKGYACRDQIGYGYDAVFWTNNPVGPWNQVKMPVYAWNNKKSNNITELPFVELTNNDNINQTIQANRDYYNYTSSFNGTSGVGTGTLANRPTTCTTGVGYWATDQGNWNKSGDGGQGILYKCTSTNVWTLYYTPCTYPHPLATGTTPPADTTAPASPVNLVVQ
jgi:hypothetical protein